MGFSRVADAARFCWHGNHTGTTAMNNELMRIIDSICRDKNIDRDSLLADIEAAITSAVRKHYEEAEEAEVKVDIVSGDIRATVDGEVKDVRVLGRIAAQAAKQMIIQKTRDRERTSIYEDFTNRRGSIVTGAVIRAEGGNLLVNIGRTEGFLPRSEQIPGETHMPGERLRALILEVREQPNQVKIILSRSHPEFIERLFELEVPEVAEHIIEIRALAREAGYRSKVAVSSIDSKVDAVGACVGVRGSRIKNIVDELGGEKIDIVRWNESSQILIQNALKPAEIQEVALCFELNKATVVVAEDQLSLAIGKRGQNVRLAARLTGWDIDILTPAEYNKHLENMDAVLKSVEGVDDVLLDKLIAFGCVSVGDIDDIGPEPLVKELDLEPQLTERLVEAAGEEVIRQLEEREAQEKLKAEEAAAAAEAGESAESTEAERGEPAAVETVGTDVESSPTVADAADEPITTATAVETETPAEAPSDEDTPAAAATDTADTPPVEATEAASPPAAAAPPSPPAPEESAPPDPAVADMEAEGAPPPSVASEAESIPVLSADEPPTPAPPEDPERESQGSSSTEDRA
jgi:N utilization substance protein A